MSIFTLLFPDFSLILIGFLLARHSHWGGHFWAGVEKPVLLPAVSCPAVLHHRTHPL
jgi:predicted permease